jgi:hypothetical protein
MPTAFDIAGREYERPSREPTERSGLRSYSKYAGEILWFFVQHRIALASHMQRFRPDLFTSDRDARRHLATLVEAGDLSVISFSVQRPNIYLITDQGFDRAADFMTILPEGIPASYEEPSGDHLLHELLITEIAVSRYDFIRTHRPLYQHLWHDRFGFFTNDAFSDVVPDFAHAYRSPNGDMIDFVEVLSGTRSITSVKSKLQKWADWSESDEGKAFLISKYKSFGSKNPKPTFRFVIVVHNRNLIGADYGWERQVLNATFQVPEELQRRVWTTTNASLRRAVDIDSPVWHSAAYLAQHRHTWHDTPKGKRSKLVSTILAKSPSLKLFTFTDSALAA